MRKLLILLASAAAACTTAPTDQPETVTAAAAGPVAPAEAARPQIGSFGFDVAGMDRSVDPGDNFYRFANGNWDRITEIPADRSNYGMFTMLDDLSRTRTREILEEAAQTPGTRIGDLYASFMDEAAVNAAGIAPVRPMIAEIKAIRDRSQWAAQAGRLFRRGVEGPFGGFIASDDRIPTEMIMRLTQDGLGLPDRDYYLRDEATLVEKRTAYGNYLARLLTLAGEANAEARAAALLQFERGIAEVHWTRVESRDDERTYNKWALTDFARNAPGFDWPLYFRELGVAGQPNLLVSQPSAFTGTARLIGRTSQAVLNDYLLVRLLDTAAPYLATDFVDAHFNFHGTVLNGTPQNEERWKRGVTLATELIPDDISRIYVDRHFPPEAKAEADELVRNVIAAMDRRLASLTWMAPETRTRARAKLAAFTPKIGYPDRWRDYSSLRSAATIWSRTSSARPSSNISAT